MPTVQRISGHKTLAMVQRYFHAHGDHVDTAINVLGLALPGTITPELHTPAEQAPAEVVPIKATG